MISLRGVEKSFPHGPTRTYVLRRIDLDIRAGEFVSIMGPSGAGKSTLLHILGMHDQSWGGEYYFDDVAVHKLDGKKRAAHLQRAVHRGCGPRRPRPDPSGAFSGLRRGTSSAETGWTA